MALPIVTPMIPVGVGYSPKDVVCYCESTEYALELKWDGFRCLVVCSKDRVILRTKAGRQHTGFNNLAKRLEHIFHSIQVDNFILDAELVCLDERGIPSFECLINRSTELRLYCFDLLVENGIDIRLLPYLERKKRLKNFLEDIWKNLPTTQHLLLYSAHILDPKEKSNVLLKALEQDIEGCLFKHVTASYGDQRNPWVKFRNPGYSQDEYRRRVFSRKRPK